MLTNPTVEKLHTLRLAGVATAQSEQLGQLITTASWPSPTGS